MSGHGWQGRDDQQQGQGTQQSHGGQGFSGHGSFGDRLRQHRQAPPNPGHAPQPSGPFDLANAALMEIHAAGFKPEFAPEVDAELEAVKAKLASVQPGGALQDLRALDWSSIDNDTSRDLDQIEVAERVPAGIHIRVAVGDVAAAVDKGGPIDQHAAAQTQTIYTAVRNFPMLPLELSTDLTSLNEDADRQAVVLSFTVAGDGTMSDEAVGRALVRNRAQLAYSRVGPWLDNITGGAPAGDLSELRSDSARQGQAASEFMRDPATEAARSTALVDQLKLQDEATQALHKARVQNGALEFHKAEADPVVVDGKVLGIQDATQNRAMRLIEDLMVAANGVMARALRKGGRSGLQRVVQVPARWDRIVALADQHGGHLPAAPDSVALNDFLTEQRRTDPDHYADLAVAVIKLLGPGEYLLMKPDDDPTGHFGLAARDYTHSTAPNRRFPDLVTQRILHAMVDNAAAPYTDAELMAIAQHCNDADKALRKIERDMQKRVAAVAMSSKIGQTFRAVITGSSDKGIYARVIDPPFEGRVIQGGDGLDVGDKVTVKLLHTDPVRAFIDFAFAGRR